MRRRLDMNSNHVVAIVAVSIGLTIPSVANAQDHNPNPSASQSPPKKEATPKKNDASSAAKDTKKDTKKDDAPSQGALPAATHAADDAADTSNGALVGEEPQNENERRANDPKLRPKNDKESKDAASKVGETTTTAAEAISTTVQDTTRATDAPGKYNPFAIEINPLGLIVGGRVSLTFEWAPVTHHVIALSPHFVSTSADTAVSANETQSETFSGGGAELGYRYYTGHKGMNGVFVGPSLIAGVYNASLPGHDQAFTDFGVAADVGLKTVAWEHLAIGGGVGVEYLGVSHDFGDLPSGPHQVASQGVKPRLIFEAGYAF